MPFVPYPMHSTHLHHVLPLGLACTILCIERVLMNTEKTIATYSDLLSDIATEISQTCSTRNSVLNIYMGSGLPQLQLDLFKPILLENYVFLSYCLEDRELRKALQLDLEDIATSLELDPTLFQQARIQEYASAQDSAVQYAKLCMHIIRTRANASRGEVLQDFDHKKLSNNTPITLQLSAQRMREAAETV